jgi:hypothetical protein
MKTSELKLNPDNPRIIKDAKFKKLCSSVEDFPILIDLEKVCKPSPDAVFPFTSRRYRQLADDQVVPPVKRGQIDRVRACRDLIAHQQALIDGQGSLSFTDEKKRLTKINADRKELMLQKEQSKLVEAELIENAQFEKARILRDGIFLIADRVFTIMEAEEDKKKRYEIFHKEMRILLDDFCGTLKSAKDSRKRTGRRS